MKHSGVGAEADWMMVNQKVLLDRLHTTTSLGYVFYYTY